MGLDTSGWLTRYEVADLLGVAVQTILNWESAGRLSPRTRLEKGRPVHVYNPHEVAKLPQHVRRKAARDNPDELAARAFDMFDNGKKIREVVVKLRKRPEEIERLHEQWREFGGAELVLTNTARAELARFVGAFESVAELVDLVRDALGERIEAEVPDDAPDEVIERAICAVLDEATAVTP